MAVGRTQLLVLFVNFRVFSGLQHIEEKSVRLCSFQVVVDTAGGMGVREETSVRGEGRGGNGGGGRDEGEGGVLVGKG